MPSIFIWKSDVPNISKKTIRFYSGSNWILEESDSSRSYMYLEQIVFSEPDTSVIAFHSKDMPRDWIGSDLLEVINVPYEIVKSDNYGILEKIGDWMRFTSNNEIHFEEKILKTEFSNIKKWINQQNIYQNKKSDISFDPCKIQYNFQQFLNKYNVTSMM